MKYRIFSSYTIGFTFKTRLLSYTEEKLLKKSQRHAEGKEGGGADNLSDSGSDSDSDSDAGSSDDDNEDTDFKEKDENAVDFQGREARQGGLGGAGMKVTVRNLRIREDIPKYLRNLDLNSAFYDPKTRSMRSNPHPDQNPEDLAYAGDNFVRHTGDALKMAGSQVLCWDMQARGEEIDIFSNPTQAEMVHEQFTEKSRNLVDEKKNKLLDKYGKFGKELDPRLRLGQTESYTEYSRDGRIIRGEGKISRKTKYEEDVFSNNHTSVWGSYFSRDKRKWGYKCCHSCIQNSFCTGIIGREQNDAKEGTIDSFQEKRLVELSKKQEEQQSRTKTNFTSRNDLYGESTSKDLDPVQVQAALERAKKANAKSDVLGKKRDYSSMEPIDVSVEDMEAYRLTKVSREDPMAHILDSEELLEYE